LISVPINIPISQSRKESRRSWFGFANAFRLSLETIILESLTIFLEIPPIKLAATRIPMAGGMLLFIVLFGMKRKLTIFISWKCLLPRSAFIAIGIITWYDSVSRIGAAKESVLFGSVGNWLCYFWHGFFFMKGYLLCNSGRFRDIRFFPFSSECSGGITIILVQPR